MSTAAEISGALAFDPVDHRYTLDGETLPSVTRILRPLSNATYASIPRDVLANKAAIGQAAHKAAELYDANRLDVGGLHPVIRPYLDAYVDFRAKRRFLPLASELRVWHPGLRYAGTLDTLGTMDGEPALVDLKCTAATMPSVGPQTAAYQNAAAETPELGDDLRELARTARRWCLRLCEDGTYRLEACADPADWRVFLSLVNLFYFKSRHAKHYESEL